MKVLLACEESQSVTIAFRNLGHEAYSCDTQPCSGGHPEWHYQQDVIPMLLSNWDMMIAFPPCTYLSNVGNAWFNKKYGVAAVAREENRKKAIDFFLALMEAPINYVVVENPVGIMSRVYRKPDQIIQPYWFGDDEQKRTCLWFGGVGKSISPLKPTVDNYKKPQPEYIGKGGRKIFFTDSFPQSSDRQKLRSKTFQGIANAMATQWGLLSNV